VKPRIIRGKIKYLSLRSEMKKSTMDSFISLTTMKAKPLLLLRYNGLTSFIPPCFCWDLINLDTGTLQDRVSDLDLSLLNAKSKEKIERQVYGSGAVVAGKISEKANNVPGRIFTVEEAAFSQQE
jgi:hypothetical protein